MIITNGLSIICIAIECPPADILATLLDMYNKVEILLCYTSEKSSSMPTSCSTNVHDAYNTVLILAALDLYVLLTLCFWMHSL